MFFSFLDVLLMFLEKNGIMFTLFRNITSISGGISIKSLPHYFFETCICTAGRVIGMCKILQFFIKVLFNNENSSSEIIRFCLFNFRNNFLLLNQKIAVLRNFAKLTGKNSSLYCLLSSMIMVH